QAYFVLVAAERRLDRHQGLDLVRASLRHLKAERAGLAVHHDDARAHFVDQLDIGRDDLIVGRGPARHALFHELLVGLDRELHADIGRALGLVLAPRSWRTDAEALPGIAQRQEDRLALEAAGPPGPAALHRIGDVHVQALADEHGEPAFAAVGLALVGHAREPAAVPHQKRHLALAGLPPEILPLTLHHPIT